MKEMKERKTLMGKYNESMIIVFFYELLSGPNSYGYELGGWSERS